MSWKEGKTYQGFIVKKSLYIDELKSHLYEFEHQHSKALVLCIQNEDEENLFCISFKTFPKNSNGAPHILEHTVLCGSKKFPVKDPFFSMIRRSLNTFMNAMTGNDFTCYPASSQVEKDFFNLFSVYADAVFHPLLKRESFLQEGHRLEFATPDDPKTELLFKGIVFNEMKGSLSSAESRVWHEMMQHLVPDLPYAYNSGGDPKEIPSLTYEELLEFHHTYYHPSRALFFLYGNIPLEKKLNFIEEEILKGVESKPPIKPIPLQKRFTQKKSVSMQFPSHETTELEKKGMVAIGFLTMPLIFQEDVLALSLLDSILMDTDASPLKKKLLDSKLCIQVDALIDLDMSEIPYVLLFKGCNSDHVSKISALLFKSLESIAKKPIPAHLIEASLHQLEMSRLEISHDHGPFGLTLFMRSGLVKQHGCEPENALIIHKLFEKLRLKVKDPTYLPSLIKKYFLENPHYVEISAKPDSTLLSREFEEEKLNLEKIRHRMDEDQIQQLVAQSRHLNAYQLETQSASLDCLPKISLSDVPKKCKHYPLLLEKEKNLNVYFHDCFTNQLIYADLIFDLPHVEEHDLPYLRLFTLLFHEVGCKNRSFEDNLELLHATTGGIGMSCSLHIQTKNPSLIKPSLNIRGKALLHNAGAFFTLMHEMITSLRLDEARRIKEVILQLYTSLNQRMNSSAMKYAIMESLAPLDQSSAIGHAMYGYRFFEEVKKIALNIDQIYPKLIETLERLRHTLLTFTNPDLVLSCDQESYHILKKESFYGLGELPGKHAQMWKGEVSLPAKSSRLHTFALPVAFTASAYKTVPFLHPDSPALLVATHLMENKVLHQQIREIGGAYGSGAHYSTSTGNFYFHAYRDPHIASTLTAFENSIAAISNEEFSSQDLEESKLEVIQHLDQPISPGSRAIVEYTFHRDGKEPGLRQAYRDHLLKVSKEDVSKAVQTHLFAQKEEHSIISFAGNELISLEKEDLSQFGLHV